MAALVDTCWANGVWADPVWAVGVWASSSAPAVATPTNPTRKDGGWHGVAYRMKKHRERQRILELERDEIFRKIAGETQEAYVEVRKERKALPDVVLAPVKQAVRPFAQRPGIPQAKDIDWAKLALGGLEEAVQALSAAMVREGENREKQRREFEQHISALTRQLESVEKEYARVIRELEELDDEEAIEQILQYLN